MIWDFRLCSLALGNLCSEPLDLGKQFAIMTLIRDSLSSCHGALCVIEVAAGGWTSLAQPNVTPARRRPWRERRVHLIIIITGVATRSLGP